MQQKITSKKQAKKIFRFKIFITTLIIFFLSAIILLSYRIFFVHRPVFISPISNIGFFNNTTVENKLKRNNIEYENLVSKGRIYSFSVKDQGIIYIDSSKDLDMQISSLQLILKRTKIEGKRFKSLDFRYSKPVIIF